jgi:hypothetical protein
MAKKRKLTEIDNNLNDELTISNYVSNVDKTLTENAILNILHYIPKVDDIPRGVFLHQIFAIVENKTLVHTEVQQLKENGVIKLLYCLNQDGPSNFFIMFMSDYLNSIQFMINNLYSKSNNNDIDSSKKEIYKIRSKCLENFCTYTITSKNISIFREDILKTLSSDEIGEIIETGFLSHRRDIMSSEDIYWYSHPSFGYLNEWIRLTREYVKNTIQRKKYKEISCK